MNSDMRIRILVMSGQAIKEINRVSAAEMALARNAGTASRSMNFGGGIASLLKFGSSLQWAGRQLTANFTVPIALAGGMAMKFALDNEASMVRLQKVYGDGTRGAQFYAKEISSLGVAFEAMSNKFGVARSDVQNIAADWAAAGSSGLALAKSTKLTLDTMILGELDAKTATQSLIAIQAQYSMSTDQLSKTIDQLNMVENQTGVSMAGLIDGFQRAAGTARETGVDTLHLAAMLAALVPASGGAAQAGNALKTIFSRLLSPTKEATQVMGLMGINTKDLGWQSLTASQRLEKMATTFKGLDSAQKVVVSSTIASRWQINKFAVLMTDMVNPAGYYQKALNGAADANANFRQKQFELNAVLSSSPQRLQQVKTTLQNAMADVIVPLIPIIVGLAGTVANLATSFAHLDPSVQKVVGTGLLLVAVLGPILMYLGSFSTLIGYVLKGFLLFGGIIPGVVARLWAFNGVSQVATVTMGALSLVTRGFGLAMQLAALGGLTVMITALELLWRNFGILGTAFRRAIPMIVNGLFALGPIMYGWAVTLWANMSAIWTLGMARLAVNMRTLPLLFAVAMAGVRNVMMLALNPILYFMRTTMLEAAAIVNIGLGYVIRAFTGLSAVGPVVAKASGVIVYNFQMMGARIAWIFRMIPVAFMSAMTALTAGSSVIPRIMGVMTALFAGGGAAIATTLMRFFSTIPILLEFAMVRMRTLVVAGMAALQAAFSAGWTAVLMIQYRITAAMQTALMAAGALMTRIWATVSTALIAIQTATRNLMIVIWGGLQTALATITRVGGAILAATWAATSTLLTTVWASVTMSLRIIWASFMLWLRSPAMIIASMQAIGSFMLMGMRGVLFGMTALLTRFVPVLISALTSPWGLAIIAAVVLFYTFKDKIAAAYNAFIAGFQTQTGKIASAFAPLANFFGTAVDFIERQFNRLPQGVQNAFQAVVNIVRDAAMAVYNLFSYLNPFAHHSPSLVENVTKGMQTVQDQYKAVANPGLFAQAIRDVTAYKKAMAGLGIDEFAGKRVDIGKSFPSLLPLFDKLHGQLNGLNAALAQQEAIVNNQQAVVDAWKTKLDSANDALQKQQDILDGLQGKLDKLTAAYDAHKSAMESFANAPLVGMQAMDDAIFSNEQSIKKLQLAMMNMAGGQSIDDLRNKYASLQGEIDKLRGMKETLRAAGAGSDVLATYDQQITGLQNQAKATQDAAGPLADMQAQLDALQKRGQKLDLEKSLKFDALTRQIQQAANTTKELDFATIIAGISKERAAMDALQPSIDAATAAVDKQKIAVDSATVARDAVQKRYDAESKSLDTIKTQYQQYKDTVDSVTTSLNDMATAASTALSAAQSAKDKKAGGAGKLSPGAQNFVDAKGGNFPDVGGISNVGRAGGVADQSKQIDAWLKDNANGLQGSFASIDMFAPIKDMWNKAWAWVEQNIAPTVSAVWDGLVAGWNNMMGSANPFAGLGDKLHNTTSDIQKWWDELWPHLSNFLRPFVEDFTGIWDQLQKAWDRVVKELGPSFLDLFKALGPFLKVAGQIIGVVLVGALKILFSILANVIGPVLNYIIDTVKNLVRVFQGVIEFWTGVFTGDFTKMWQGIKDIFGGLWAQVISIFQNGWDIIWGIVAGFVQGIIDFFYSLYDELVGHSIVPDMINAIVAWFTGLPQSVMNGISSLWKSLVDFFSGAWNAVTTALKTAWTATSTWLSQRWGAFTAALGDIAGKFKTWATTAWTAVQTGFSNAWTALNTWLGQRWTAITTGLGDIGGKLKTFGSTAMTNFWTGLKSIWDGKAGIIGWFQNLPGAIASAMSGIGGVVANSVKGAWNSAASWIDSNGIDNVNKITSLFSVTIPRLPTFQRGGVLPGYSSKDDTLAMLRSGEGVIVPEAVRALGGSKGIGLINKAASTGNLEMFKQLGVPAFADGGVLGAIQNGIGSSLAGIIRPMEDGIRAVMPDGFMENLMVGYVEAWAKGAEKWGKTKDVATGPQATGSGGVDRWSGTVLAVLKALNQPGTLLGGVLRLINKESGGNPNAINLWDTNAQMGMPSQGLIQVIPPTFAAYAGAYRDRGILDPFANIYAGLNYALARYGSIGAVDPLVHSGGYDSGGVIKTGMTMVKNMSGKDEYVLTNPQMKAVEGMVTRMDRLETLVTARQQRGGGGDTYHLHGDLVMPNIKSGSDASTFIDNLKALVG